MLFKIVRLLLSVLNRADTDHRTDRDVVRNGVTQYGWDNCYSLARFDSGQAATNPDNLKYFAEMSMSPQVRWSPSKPSTSKRSIMDGQSVVIDDRLFIPEMR